MTGNETRRVLRDLALASPAVIDATAVSKDGVMLTVEPAEYASAEGADISDQEQVRRLAATQKPVMSGVFATVEGVNATDLEHPVFAPSGQFNGFGQPPLPSHGPADHRGSGGPRGEVRRGLRDGHGRPRPVRPRCGRGREEHLHRPALCENPELLAIAKRMQTEPEGTGTYTFAAEGSATPVLKEVAWTSVGLHGTEWRVVAVNATPPA